MGEQVDLYSQCSWESTTPANTTLDDTWSTTRWSVDAAVKNENRFPMKLKIVACHAWYCE